MGGNNVEVVRELYRRAEQDGRFPDQLLDDEIEWVNPALVQRPGGGAEGRRDRALVRRGGAQVRPGSGVLPGARMPSMASAR
jgi:hypothetical protein